MPRDGSGTRSEILHTSMRLFVEQGYDKTSLREIAESVGVTKAALYYHFRTKDDIVLAATEAYFGTLNDVMDWLGTQSPSPERDEALVDRISALFDGPLGTAMRFNQANPTVVAREEFQHANVGRIQRFVGLVAGPDADATGVLRATLAFGALAVSSVPGESPLALGTPAESRAAGRTVALELLAALRDA